ncbi:S-methyl-5'-thioadenosine phosphorylase [Paenibacillus mesotrionivorans]|uniref:S-methyl-5'-thioadenosine phosphorylase n=1 Tax=Paenibacillus mesotrionivorans TaxID=3160968 RepID=A0ACC7NSS6_9BACL
MLNRYKVSGLRIAVIGGSGFYHMNGSSKKVLIETPYGAPSAPITIAEINGFPVAFLPRHGDDHQIPPHKINYKANLWALKQVGVERIISTGAVGSLRAEWNVGDIVICDQFVNKTWNRADTYYDGPVTTHISVSDPYCSEMREALIESGRVLQLNVREDGVLLVIEGPRFSTRAENRDWFRSGYDLISMTHYPEVVLARELGMCYTSACLITDYANILGAAHGMNSHSGHKDVIEAYAKHKENLVRLIEWTIAAIPKQKGCQCSVGLESARADSELVASSNKVQLFDEQSEKQLRYGHNPHQVARWNDSGLPRWTLVSSSHEKQNMLSLTDLQNIDKASRILKYQLNPAVVIIKHGLVTGASYGEEPLEMLYMKALQADPAAARTGTVAINRKMNASLLQVILQHGFDVIAAAEWEPDALAFMTNSNTVSRATPRLVSISSTQEISTFRDTPATYLERYTFCNGSYAEEDPFTSRVQTIGDFSFYCTGDETILTGEQKSDMLFAWYLTVNSRTNSAVIVNSKHVLAVSAGNQDGISAVELALYRASSRYRDFTNIKGSIMATDGNFPFENPSQLLADHQIEWIIMPGGATNDMEIIKTFNSLHINVALSGERCFCHF